MYNSHFCRSWSIRQLASLSSVSMSVTLCIVANQYSLIHQKCLNKWRTAPPPSLKHHFTTFNPIHWPHIPTNFPPPKFRTFIKLLYRALLITREHFVHVDANCENRSLVVAVLEYCYHGDDWRTIGYFSATTALLFWYIIEVNAYSESRFCEHIHNNMLVQRVLCWREKTIRFYCISAVAKSVAIDCLSLIERSRP